MAAIVHRYLKIRVFNVNGIGRQVYEARKQLKTLRMDVALFSETHLKPHIKFYLQNYDFIWTDRHDGHKGGTAVAV
jgi:exonuclease III